MRAACLALASALLFGATAPPDAELAALNVQLRRAALAALEEHEPARKADPESLVLFSLDADAVIAGIAVGTRADGSGTLGFAYLSAAAGDVGADVYALELQISGIVVDLVDARGRVVASVTLDPPLPGRQTERLWPAAFLTVARWLAPRMQ